MEELVKLINSLIDEVGKLIKEIWHVILVLLLVYLAWDFNLLKELLFLLGVIALGKIAWIFWVHYPYRTRFSTNDGATRCNNAKSLTSPIRISNRSR